VDFPVRASLDEFVNYQPLIYFKSESTQVNTMRTVNLNQLPKVINKVEIISLEGPIYIANLLTGDGQYRLCEEDGSPYRRQSLQQVVFDLAHSGFRECYLVQHSAYDEMVGQPGRAGSNALRVPVAVT
jgi:hypothetical protein